MSKLFDKEFMELIEVPVLEEYLYWELLQQRKILINENIESNIIEKAVMPILKFNEQDKDIPPEKRKPIILYINTLGGDVQNGLTLCSVIEQSSTPVHGITLSYAASMGAIIHLACHKRIGYKYSSWLFHDGFFTLANSGKKAKQTMEYYDKLDEKIMHFVLSRTSISKEMYEERAADEWWIDADEALKYGIIDEIIGMEGISK